VVTRQPFQLTLTGQAEGTIHYTTNGSLPTADSTLYTEPISIEQPTVIRAQQFDASGRPVSDASTKSYLILNHEQTIPVISIVTDWAHLYRLHDYPLEHDDNRERPITVEYFAPGGQPQFKAKARIRIDESGPNLLSLKKSYRLNFQPDSLEHQLSADSPVGTFNTLLLRAAFGEDFPYHNVRAGQPQPYVIESIGDQAVRNLCLAMDRPAPHGQWVLLYLNGEYWGLYSLVKQDGELATGLGQFSRERVKAEILRQAAIVRPYVPLEADRWASGLSPERFDQQIQEALTLVDEREDVALNCQTFTDFR
jgi:hypothetical protein